LPKKTIFAMSLYSYANEYITLNGCKEEAGERKACGLHLEVP